jgi:hypothetical protein
MNNNIWFSVLCRKFLREQREAEKELMVQVGRLLSFAAEDPNQIQLYPRRFIIKIEFNES